MRSGGMDRHELRSRLALISISIVSAALLASCATSVNQVPPTASNWNQGQTFSSRHWKRFPAPQPNEAAQSMTLYGTYYFTPTHPYSSGGVPIQNLAGADLGPRISQTAFCKAANEGAFRAAASPNGPLKTYNFQGVPSDASSQTDCTEVFSRILERYRNGQVTDDWPLIVSRFERSRFGVTSSAYGTGSRNHEGGRWWLVPWRTIATDNSLIAPGTVLYIPQVAGLSVTLPSGDTVRHDGYFIAGDSGKGINGNHVDFFTGQINPENRPPLLRGIDGEANAFVAQIVQRDDIAAHLKGLHACSGDARPSYCPAPPR